MSRHNRELTPPDKRRAPKGSIIGQRTIKVDANTVAALEYLLQCWGVGEHRTWRRALWRMARAEGMQVSEPPTDEP